MTVNISNQTAERFSQNQTLTNVSTTDFEDPVTKQLRKQVWTGLLLAHLIIVIASRMIRLARGESAGDVPLINHVIFFTMITLALLGLLLRNTRYAERAFGAYTLMIHLITPAILWFYGGTLGFGDIASVTAFVLSLLYGFRRWMIATGSVIVLTLVYLVYLDTIEQSVNASLALSPQFVSLKFTATIAFLIMVTYFLNAFYRNLLDKYRETQSELRFANTSLWHSKHELEQLAEDLQRSRLQIVTTRAEEQRRLRRDLHDGLGPTLAAQIFRVGAIRNNLYKNVDKSAELLVGLESAIDGTLADVRRLVYNLRPPLLDQLGLHGAITNFVESYNVSFDIELDLSEHIPLLNAATEVAAFRIVQTAIDNVAQHARATYCTVALSAESNQLNITISDNGIGIPEGHLNGVGLTSMRERSEELGGTFTIFSLRPSGTAIAVSLPIEDEFEDFDD